MGRDGGRRVFLVALLACLGLLAFLYARRSVDAQILLERRYPRVNTHLYLTVDKDNVVTVEGEGKLYSADMVAMLKGAGLHKSTVTDVIIGEGITEIGYDTFNNYENLQALKFGENVVRVAAGGLKTCTVLKYLYYPTGLKDIGLDFLYDCKNCYVVTSGKASKLPEFANVRKKTRVLGRVDSREALVAASGDADLPVSVARWWQTARA